MSTSVAASASGLNRPQRSSGGTGSNFGHRGVGGGRILIGQRVAVAVEETITLEEVGALTLKGLTQPVVAYNVPLAPIQPALRVIEGGPQSV
jgi:hypothetical protein